MTIGTKSLIYGAHAFWFHPFMVALSWWKLYGFPWDPRLWMAFFLHDIGYFGKHNMDGAEGETHPYLGASLMTLFFGKLWGSFTLRHSRSLAFTLGQVPSRLCAADKYAFVITPKGLYLWMVNLTREITEYKEHYRNQHPHMVEVSDEMWHRAVSEHLFAWVTRYNRGLNETRYCTPTHP